MALDYSLVFDAKYYADKYSDLKAAFGYDKTKLLNHFKQFGMKEGRMAKATFDVYCYKNNYADLWAVYKDDLKSYYIHYMTYGYKEGRVAYKTKNTNEKMKLTTYKGKDYSLVYEPNFYVDKYADLKAAFGSNENLLIEHFVKYGMKEGRQGNANFIVEYYKKNYEDLQKAFGTNTLLYYDHYITYGNKEGRVANKLLKQETSSGSTSTSLSYTSPTGTITIEKQVISKVNVYMAHLVFKDYTRFKTFYNASATTSKAAVLTSAILCVNGSAAKINGSGEMHDGLIPDFSLGKYCTPALYSQKTGKLFPGFNSSYANMKLVDIRDKGIATDTFGFGNAFLKDGKVLGNNTGSKRPRTFIGTNEKAGDIWICVAEGDGVNGGGAGLNSYECATILKNKGCTLGYPLDGGGSSTIVFQGKRLNTLTGGVERGSIGDFVYFK